MADYKSMYFYLAGRTASAIDALEANAIALKVATKALDETTSALVGITEKLKSAQQITEEMFINGDDGLDND